MSQPNLNETASQSRCSAHRSSVHLSLTPTPAYATAPSPEHSTTTSGAHGGLGWLSRWLMVLSLASLAAPAAPRPHGYGLIALQVIHKSLA